MGSNNICANISLLAVQLTISGGEMVGEKFFQEAVNIKIHELHIAHT